MKNSNTFTYQGIDITDIIVRYGCSNMPPQERNREFLAKLNKHFEHPVEDQQGLTYCYALMSGINYAMKELT